MTSKPSREARRKGSSVGEIHRRSLSVTLLALLGISGLFVPAGSAFAQVPATCVISGTVLTGGVTPVPNTNVRIRTVSPTAVGNYGITTNDLTTTTDVNGVWSLTVIQGLKAQIDIPAVGIANDIIVPTGVSCPAAFGSLTLYTRGTQTPATIISNAGPSMGGDLIGTSPNPSVIALRGQALAAGNCTNGQARVYSSGSSSYTCQTVTAGSSVTSITGGTGISVTGTATVPIVGISAGGVTSTQLGTGAAAANLGAAGGALTGTYPSPTLAAGVASTNVGALGGDLSGTLPSPSVATVGGQTAANVAAGAVLANASTTANTGGTIVRRDGSGNFNAGTVTGALAGNATTATTLSSTLTGDASSAGNAVTVTGLRGRPLGNTAPTSNQVLSWTGSAWDAASAVGTVTSVAASGGATGMSFSGSPVTSAGTLTLAGTLGIGFGGTGQTSPNAGFNALSPMTTVGDTIYEGTGPIAARLAGNASSTKNFLTSTGSAGLATAPAWGTIVAADLPASITSNTSGTAAGLSVTLALGSGGTGQTSAANAFNALSPTTTTGDISYANGAGTNTRLAGNSTTARQFLLSQGTGAAAQAPSWTALVSGDIPANAANTSGSAGSLSATLGVATGGTGATTFAAGVLHASGTSAFTSSTVALGSEVSGQLPIGSGGTGQASAGAAYNALAPTTTAGDFAYANGAGTNTRLAGNATATKMFMQETSSVPTWAALVAGDIPNLPATILTSGTVATAQLPTLAGDVTGTIVANTVGKIQGRTVVATAPSDLQYLGWNNGSSQWEPKTIGASAVTQVSGSGGSTGLTLTGGPTGAVTLTLGGTLAVANGGTGQTTAAAAFNGLSPITTLGDTIYGSASNTSSRLAGNTTTTRKFMRQTGDGANSAAPAWDTLVAGDVPALDASKITTGSLIVAQGGTGAATLAAGVIHGNGTSALTSSAVVLSGAEVSGQLGLANGGTGQATANLALNALLPSQGGNNGKVLKTDGSNTSWSATGVGDLLANGSVPLTAAWVMGNFKITAQNTRTLFNVISYGAVGNGATDDTASINNAIAAAAAAGGGTVYFPKGVYKITSTLNVGDGSAAGRSSYHNVRLEGDGGPTNNGTIAQAVSVLQWQGAASGVMVNVKGPISGTNMANLFFDANATAATCLRTDHMADSAMSNLYCSQPTGEGIIVTAYPNPTGVVDGANENIWSNLRVVATSGAGVTGVRIGESTTGGGAHLDVAQNVFVGLNMRIQGVPATGLKLQFTDASFFYGSTISANVPVDIVPVTGNLAFPGAIEFSGFTGSNTYTISNATNATPIVVTTTTAHGQRIGDWVAISGVNGNTAANGSWKLLAASGTSMTLGTASGGNSVGNGAYTFGGTVQGSGFQETTGTWTAGTLNTAPGIFCPGLNPEGWDNFLSAPPPALRGLKGFMTNGQAFGVEFMKLGYNPVTPAPIRTDTVLQLVSPDSSMTPLELGSFGTLFPMIAMRRTRGTALAPTATQSGDTLGAMLGYGYGATGNGGTSAAGMYLQTAENWTDAAHGAKVVIVTTPSAGTATSNSLTVENDGQMTNIVKGLSGKTPIVIFTQTADKVTTANTDTTLFSTGTGTLTLPANFLAAGRMIKVTMAGFVSVADGGAGTKTLNLKLGATSIASGSSIATQTTVANQFWTATAVITCRTTGAGGTVVGYADWDGNIAASTARYGLRVGSLAPVTVNTTGTLAIDLIYNNGNATGTLTTTNAVVEVFN
jgi:hypothetical protein